MIDLDLIVNLWIALMLSIQSVILYKLLPLIKKMDLNFGGIKDLFSFKGKSKI